MNRTSAHAQDKVTWSIFPPDTPKTKQWFARCKASGKDNDRHETNAVSTMPAQPSDRRDISCQQTGRKTAGKEQQSL